MGRPFLQVDVFVEKEGMIMRKRFSGSLACLLVAAGAWADSDFILPPVTDSHASNSVISARSIDSENNLRHFLEVVPRNRAWKSTDPDAGAGKLGTAWTNRYGFVGVSYLWPKNNGQGAYVDGMNEKGLSVALLEFPLSETQFPAPVAGDANVSVRAVVNWILGTCATVQEATNALAGKVVWRETDTYLVTLTNSYHLVVHDASNNSAVVDWCFGSAFVYGPDSVNPYRVVAGDPQYADQCVRLFESYMGLNRTNGMKIPKGDVYTNSQLALPGDNWSPSRFVRMNRLLFSVYDFYQPLSTKGKTEYPPFWRILLADRILRRETAVWGEIARSDANLNGPWFHTVCSLVRDHSERMLYVRDVYNQNLRRIDLSRLDFTPSSGPLSSLQIGAPPDADSADDASALAYDLTGMLVSPDETYDWIAGLTLHVTVPVALPDIGKTGHVYIFRRDPDKKVYGWTGSAWSACDATTMVLPSCYSGTLQPTTFSNLIVDAWFQDWYGRVIYAGYGTTATEMLMEQRYRPVFVGMYPIRIAAYTESEVTP